MTSSFPLKRMKKLVEILITIFIKERNRCFFLVLLKRGDFLILFIWHILKKHQFSLAGHLSLASLLKRLMWHSAIQNGFAYVSFHKHFSEKQTHLKLQGIRVRKSSGVAFLDLLTDSVAAVAELLHSASGTKTLAAPPPPPKEMQQHGKLSWMEFLYVYPFSYTPSPHAGAQPWLMIRIIWAL